MEQIIIDGVDLSELKVKYDALAAEQAAMRASIVKGSAKYISDAIEQVRKHVEEMKEAEELPVAEEAAAKATELLKNANFVAEVSGVAYDMPYYAEYTDYSSDDVITRILEDGDFPLLSDNDSKVLSALYNIADEMENEVREWNTSYC